MRPRDRRHRFLIESCNVRGQLVQLDESWVEACARSDYPPAVRQVLGEAFVAATLLAGTIKFRGKLTLQVRGQGAIHLLVVQVTHDGQVRGLARFGREPDGEDLEAIFGESARMTVGIDTDGNGEFYQGVVALEGATLAEALSGYFRNSEQLPTELLLAVSARSAAGVLLQRLPAEARRPRDDRDMSASEDTEGWNRALTLTRSLAAAELLELEAAVLLQRLFHEERVRLYEGQDIEFSCSCSRTRTDGMLMGLGEDEVNDILRERSTVEVICEFCDAAYRYDAIDVEALFRGPGTGAPASSTRH